MFYKSISAAFGFGLLAATAQAQNLYALRAGLAFRGAVSPLISWLSTRAISPMPGWR